MNPSRKTSPRVSNRGFTVPESACPACAVPERVTGQSLTRQILLAAKNPHQINLGSSVPHPDFLPTNALRQAVHTVTRTFGKRCFDTEELLGNPELKRQIARRMAELNCNDGPDDIVVTHGARDSVRLALMAVCQPGDIVAIESPTFYGLLQAIESCGMKALEIPTHPRDGLSLDALRLAVEQWPIRACLLVPNYNNPLGSCMPDVRKKELVELCEKQGIAVIEDDVYGDLGFGAAARPSPACGAGMARCCTARPSPKPCRRGCGWAGWCRGSTRTRSRTSSTCSTKPRPPSTKWWWRTCSNMAAMSAICAPSAKSMPTTWPAP